MGRPSDDKDRKWKCTDLEIQKHVVRSLAAFLDSSSGASSNHRLLKDSLADIVEALVWILHCKSEAIISMTVNVVVKLVSSNGSMMQLYLTDLVNPLSSLLCSDNFEVATSSATALNMVLSNLSAKREKQVWDIVKDTKILIQIIRIIREFPGSIRPIENFQEMASLLYTILWRWPQSRYFVWNDTILIKVLEDRFTKSHLSTKVSVLKLYSALALCNKVAKELLENGETILTMMVSCMDGSEPLAIRIEGFRLAQHLAADEQRCVKMTSFCSGPLIKAIIGGMRVWRLGAGKGANDLMSLLDEACRLALISRWPGEHHHHFWEQGIDEVLLDLLFENFDKQAVKHPLSPREQMFIAQEGLDNNFLLALRPYIWEIFGWLAVHCAKDFRPRTDQNELCIDMLIMCACLSFVEAICKGCQICENNDASRSESSSRAVLVMMHSSNTYIGSKVKLILSGVLEMKGNECLKRLLRFLDYASSANNFGSPNIPKTVFELIGLICYSELPQYQKNVIRGDGMKTLVTSIKSCLSNQVCTKRRSFALHFYNNVYYERSCCWMTVEEWEGKDALLFYSLWGLALFLQHSSAIDHTHIKSHLIKTVQEVLDNVSATGPRWLAANILSFFGVYGFPGKQDRGSGKALEDKEHTDLQLFFANGESVSVHKIVLAVRCPSLLPPEQFPQIAKTTDNVLVRDIPKNLYSILQKEVRLSALVDQQALLKLLDYVYYGYLEAGEELARKLKTLAKSCNMQPLFQMLCRKIPKWGTPIPKTDLTDALGSFGFQFTDIILEAKGTEQMSWACSFCSLLVPHMHAHKIILQSRCKYLQALFLSGMQESHSQSIKVPVSWEALIKLVQLIYSHELPDPPFGCVWDNMDTEERLYELKPYVELYWLAKFWILEDVQEDCFTTITSCLDSDRHLAVEVMKLAYGFSLWKLAEVAADYMAPLYPKLRDSGVLEQLDDLLIELVRDASVRLTQER
ncbi:hypothetical protein F3Y22_tig00001120pilonHSYRG00349 [Hibiscus syriacus]|uniref:BTB domain-containing protein n=1 Tax=Hibiscus syriacus TaxID=106335 RepID=A0A6A3CWD3_HIBSY|nr:hypothetical protein F3Y22_tig00001120pilonHSYRG00349 [Hibiscus syriacus]